MALLGWLVLLVLAVTFTGCTLFGLMLTGKLDGEGVFLGVCSAGLWSGVAQMAPFTVAFI
jgi:hypothetical protein